MGAINNTLGNPEQPKQTLNTALNAMLDKEGLKKRFEELMGSRTPQFMSSIVSLVNATPGLLKAWQMSPMTIIQAALKAAIFDLPIDPNLGFAYIVPFNRSEKQGSEWVQIPEAQFIMGYKGMQQLAMRTGAYERINVIDIREGELEKYDRLKEDVVINFIEDDDEREKRNIIAYAGYFRLKNGMEKVVIMTTKQIDAHEKKNRKGNSKGKGWREDYQAMCAKTVMRQLLGKWGLMSIDYRQSDDKAITAATAIVTGNFDDETQPTGYIETTSDAPEISGATAPAPLPAETTQTEEVDPLA